MKDKQVTGNSQYGFLKGKCLTNFIDSYNDMPGLVDERRAADFVYLDFSNTFDTSSHNTFS